MNKLRRLAGETVIYGLSTVLGRFLNFLLVPFYTRIFHPEEYGVVTELYAYITFLLIIYTYGMETAFFRFISKEKNSVQTFSTSFYSLLGSSLIFSSLLWFFAEPAAIALDYPNQAHLIQWTGLILFFDTLAIIPFAWLRYESRAFKFSLLKLGHIVINIAFNVIFLVVFPWMVAQPGYESVISIFYSPEIGPGYVFLANMLASALIIPFFVKEFSLLRLYFNPALWKRMVTYSLPLVVIGLAGMINEVSDRLMLKHLLPYESQEARMHDLGVYGACYKLSIFMTLGIQAFRYAAEPFFFKEAEEENAPKTYATVLNYFVAAGSLVFLGISLFLDLIKHIIDSAYHEGIIIVPILLMANLFLGIFYNTSVWYKLTNKTGIGAIISFSGAAITIVGNLLLIPLIGYIGAALTTLVCYVFMSVTSWRVGRKHYYIPYDIGLISKILFSAVLLLLIAEGINYYLDWGLIPAYLTRIAALGLYCRLLMMLLNTSLKGLLALIIPRRFG